MGAVTQDQVSHGTAPAPLTSNDRVWITLGSDGALSSGSTFSAQCDDQNPRVSSQGPVCLADVRPIRVADVCGEIVGGGDE
jgi:hypothetical protein